MKIWIASTLLSISLFSYAGRESIDQFLLEIENNYLSSYKSDDEENDRIMGGCHDSLIQDLNQDNIDDIVVTCEVNYSGVGGWNSQNWSIYKGKPDGSFQYFSRGDSGGENSQLLDNINFSNNILIITYTVWLEGDALAYPSGTRIDKYSITTKGISKIETGVPYKTEVQE